MQIKLLPNKKELTIVKVIKDFKLTTENSSNLLIKAIDTDSRKEFTNKTVKDIFIGLNYTIKPPYTHKP